MSPIIGILLGLVFVLLNGLFVAIEFALARISRTKVETKVEQGNKTSALILHALDHIDDYISASQVGITIASLALGAIGELTIAKSIEPSIESILPSDQSGIATHTISLALALLIVTYFHVVIGEIIPKTIAFVNPEKTALLIWPLELFRIIISPLVVFLNISASSVLRVFGIKDLRTTFVYTEDELKMLLNVSQEEGVLEQSEKEMITNIFDFPDTVAREVMTPRTDMVCIEATKLIEEAVGLVIESKHSRIPIYEDSIDNVIGMINTRDILEEIHSGNYKKLVKEITKPVIKVPESKPLDDLLSELKKESQQIAIIIDEFGGTSGLITIEDIVEEIVGDIGDEYDKKEEEPIRFLENNEVLIDGKINIDELNEKLGSDFSKDHYDTIGGLTFGLIGKEPEVGAEVESNGYVLRVEEIDPEKQRIKLVRLIQSNKEQKNGKEDTNNSDNKEIKLSKQKKKKNEEKQLK